MAGANNGGAIGCESDGSDVGVLGRQRARRSFGDEIVQPHLLANARRERVAVRRNGQRKESPGLGEGSLELARRNIPQPPFTLLPTAPGGSRPIMSAMKPP